MGAGDPIREGEGFANPIPIPMGLRSRRREQRMYTAERYAAIFGEETGEVRAVREGVNGYRVKTVRAGDTLEIEGYAIWNTQRTAAEARRQSEKHREQVQAVNLRNRQKHLRRLINSNFGAGDLLVTLTYGWEQQPADEKAAGKDLRAFLRRIRRQREKLGLPELKYIYTTEVTHGGLGTRYHHHLILNGGMPREAVEAVWRKGLINTRIARPDGHGLSGWAHYMAKRKATQMKASKRGFNCSRNLRKPKITTADHKLSVRRMRELAEDMEGHGAEIFGKLYPGYVLTERPEVKWSSWVTGVYLSARLIRMDAIERDWMRLTTA